MSRPESIAVREALADVTSYGATLSEAARRQGCNVRSVRRALRRWEAKQASPQVAQPAPRAHSAPEPLEADAQTAKPA